MIFGEFRCCSITADGGNAISSPTISPVSVTATITKLTACAAATKSPVISLDSSRRNWSTPNSAPAKTADPSEAAFTNSAS
ncbi:hypothetical protein [Tenggerimyces flavus]|uniref:Uncharacterized protein n=1 Tax=Tenggerimyces flavus TaxID=1708749 RepID=A0ABV7Y4Q9_9ACTN|nr:hypothetical protein [Tenggerimyces flavus]MBM7790338.1 hypothetical protein [Tenggerimyces flavus]